MAGSESPVSPTIYLEEYFVGASETYSHLTGL